jgi:putative oxidoreductase
MNFHTLLQPSSSRWQDLGLLVLRFGPGLVFVMHGWQKLAVFGHAGVAQGFVAIGIPFPVPSAALITAVELGGGALLLAGAATRVAAALLAFAMFVAVTVVHLPNGFFAPNGIEFPLSLLLSNVAIGLAGAGNYSIDALVSARQSVPHATSWKAAA